MYNKGHICKEQTRLGIRVPVSDLCKKGDLYQNNVYLCKKGDLYQNNNAKSSILNIAFGLVISCKVIFRTLNLISLLSFNTLVLLFFSSGI